MLSDMLRKSTKSDTTQGGGKRVGSMTPNKIRRMAQLAVMLRMPRSTNTDKEGR